MGNQPANEKPEPEEERHIPPPGQWDSTMDEIIEEAMRRGDFNDLPGRGKPLKVLKNPYAPGTELAYQLLKDNNYTLPWIVARNKALADIEAFRLELGVVWRRYTGEFQTTHSETVRMALAAGWRDQLEACQEQIQEINALVADANLKQPGERLEILKLTLEGELRRAGADWELA
jgi:DnaJ family protein C protein 28